MSDFEDIVTKFKQERAEGRNKTKAEDLVVGENGNISRRENSFKGGTRNQRRRNESEDVFPTEAGGRDLGSKSKAAEIIKNKRNSEKERVERLGSLDQAYSNLKKMDENRLLFIERSFNKKGDLRKRKIPLELADKNVQEDLGKLRSESRKQRIFDIKEFLLERNRQLDMEKALEYKENKQQRIKILQTEIMYLEKDIADLAKAGKDTKSLKSALNEKINALNSITGKKQKKEVSLPRKQSENNTQDTFKSKNREKVHHWPPEGFVQKPGVVHRWPPAVDNLNYFKEKKDYVKDGLLDDSVNPEQTGSESREEIEKELKKLEEEYVISVGKGDRVNTSKIYSQIDALEQKLKSFPEKSSADVKSNKTEGTEVAGAEPHAKTNLENYQEEMARDQERLSAELAKENPSKMVVDHYEKSITEFKKKINEINSVESDQDQSEKKPEEEDKSSGAIEGTRKPDTVLEYKGNGVRTKIIIKDGGLDSKENLPNPEAVDQDQSKDDREKENKIAEINSKISRAQKAIEDLRSVPHTENIIKGQEEIIKKLEQEKLKLEKVENESGFVLEKSEEGIDSDVKKGVSDGAKEFLQTERAKKKYEVNKDKLVSLGWSLEEYLALTPEEQDHVLWTGVKEEDYSRNKSSEQKKDISQEEVENLALVIFNRKKEVGKITLETDEEKFVFREKPKELAAALKALMEKDGPQKMPKEDEDFIKAENEKRAREINKKREELESYYENIGYERGKPALIALLKDRNLSFGGDKQKLIDRLVEDDMDKMLEARRVGDQTSGDDSAKEDGGRYSLEEIEYEKRKDVLGSLGWTKEEYLALSEKEREDVYYGKINKEKYLSLFKGQKLENKKSVLSLEKKSVDLDVSEKLKDLGINSIESISAISPEFLSLSPEKQIYLLSKLEQKIYLDADITSKVQTEENIKKMKGFSGFFKKIGANLKKGWSQVNLREDLIKEYKLNSLERYGDLIPALSGQLAIGPELKYVFNEKTKKIAPEFQYFELDEEKQDNNYWNKKYLNESASRFGEIPKEWSSDRASNRERSIYKKAEEEYERRKELLLRSLVERGQAENPGETQEERRAREAGILVELNNLDGFVKTSSALSQNPEFGNWSKEFFGKKFSAEGALGGKVTNRAILGGAFAFGAGMKKLTRQSEIAGVTMSEAAQESLNYAGLGFSTVFGGYMGYRKKNQEYKDKESRQQYGIEVKDKGVKKFGDAKISYERLNKEIDKIENETSEEKKLKLLQSLKNRIFLVEEMFDENRMNYGGLKDEALNKQKLFQSISKAKNTLLLNNFYEIDKNQNEVVFEHKLYKRFTDFIGDKSAEKYKTVQKRWAIVFGAVAGGAGYYAGGLIAEKWTEYGVGEKIGNLAAKIPNPYTEGAAWLASYLKENKLNIDTVKPPSVFPAPESAPVEVKTGGLWAPEPEVSPSSEYEVAMSVDELNRGVIGGLQELQRALRAEFPVGQEPPQYKEFLSKNPEEIAREWGAYRPGEENESAKVFKGAKFEIGKNGEVRFVDHLGATQKVFAPEVGTAKEFAGDFFSADGEQESLAGARGESGAKYLDAGYEAPPRPEAPNEGYVRSSEIKPDTANSFYEKPVPKGYGYNPVRGSYEVIRDTNGKLVDLDTRRTISDELIKFRQNPRNFLVEDLSKTDLLAKTDSFAVKTLTDNRSLIEPFIIERNILNDSTLTDLTESDRAELAKKLEVMAKDISAKTGGAFDARPEEIKAPGAPRPSRVTFFDTDNPAPKINPSTTSVSEGSDFVPKKEVPAPALETTNISGKSYEVSFGENNGKKFIPRAVEASWNLDESPALRKEAMSEMINPKYHEALKFNSDFDRMVVAQEILDSGKYAKGTGEYDAFKNLIEDKKVQISQRLRAPDVFEVNAPSLGKAVINGVEYSTNSNTPVDLESMLFKSNEIIGNCGEVNGVSKNIVSFSNGYIGIYEEEIDQGAAGEKIETIKRANGGKIGNLVDQKVVRLDNGKIRTLKIYQKVK